MPTPSDWNPDEDRLPPRMPGGKGLKFAVVMLGATAMLALGIGALLPTPLPQRATAMPPPRLNTVMPAKRAPSAVNNASVYHADASGHFFIDAAVNGTTIRFLVDTGATVVALTRDDARAIGLTDGDLDFSQAMNTANGQARAAPTTLRSVRLDQFEATDVPAVVMEKGLGISLLGMSFLNRVAGYSISGGDLTIEW